MFEFQPPLSGNGFLFFPPFGCSCFHLDCKAPCCQSLSRTSLVQSPASQGILRRPSSADVLLEERLSLPKEALG